MSHHCHALNCEAKVPPSMHMCAPHWRLVPRKLQADLWASYVVGQEQRKDPSPQYLRAAAACVRSVAEREGWSEEDIDHEVGLYEAWAELAS